MSENTVHFHVAGLELTTHEQPNPAIPSWLPEAPLVGQYWQSSGIETDGGGGMAIFGDLGSARTIVRSTMRRQLESPPTRCATRFKLLRQNWGLGYLANLKRLKKFQRV
jgi:hypothetical protein